MNGEKKVRVKRLAKPTGEVFDATEAVARMYRTMPNVMKRLAE